VLGDGGDDSVDELGGEVRNTDRLDLAGLEKLDNSLVGLDDGGLRVKLHRVTLLGEEVLGGLTLGDEGDGPVDQVMVLQEKTISISSLRVDGEGDARGSRGRAPQGCRRERGRRSRGRGRSSRACSAERREKGENEERAEEENAAYGDEELLTGDTGVSDSGADGGLVLVDLSKVKVPTNENGQNDA
jgi:hypothetical protein